MESTHEKFADVEKHIISALRVIAKAQSQLSANDLDRNGVQDYWTGDLAGMFRIERLIPREIALADASPLERIGDLHTYHGYYFSVLNRDASVDPPVEYQQDTDNSGRKVRNTDRFGFCAYPAEYGKSGLRTIAISEGMVVIKGDTKGKPIVEWPDGETLLRGFITKRSWPPRMPISVIQSTNSDQDRTLHVDCLDSPHKPGRNLLYSVTLGRAFGALMESAGEQLSRAALMSFEPLVRTLPTERVDPARVFFMSGKGEEAFSRAVANLRARTGESRERWGGISPNGHFVLSGIACELYFSLPLERHSWPIDFDGSKVQGFGYWSGGYPVSSVQSAQIKVRSYRSPSEFVLQLMTVCKSEVFIARTAPGATFNETIGKIRQSIAAASIPQDLQLTGVIIPCLNLDAVGRISKYEGFRVLDTGELLSVAGQRIRVQMNERGALDRPEFVRVGGGVHRPSPPLVVDGPFALIVYSKGAVAPYLAMWCENAQALVPYAD